MFCHPKICQFYTANGVNQYICSFNVPEGKRLIIRDNWSEMIEKQIIVTTT